MELAAGGLFLEANGLVVYVVEVDGLKVDFEIAAGVISERGGRK